jgi:hypothetical protein
VRFLTGANNAFFRFRLCHDSDLNALTSICIIYRALCVYEDFTPSDYSKFNGLASELHKHAAPLPIRSAQHRGEAGRGNGNGFKQSLKKLVTALPPVEAITEFVKIALQEILPWETFLNNLWQGTYGWQHSLLKLIWF